ncbi:MAG: glycoside hydrolase family 3 C-terminal domain-containing protein [Parafilimonas sp.]
MKKNFTLVFILVISLFTSNLHAQSTPQLGKNSVKDVVAAMTLEEKAKFVVGNGFSMPGLKKDSVLNIGMTKDKVAGASGTTFAIPRLGIPSMVVSDGPAGVRIDPIRNGDSSKTYYATAWPVATLLASSWDTALVKKVGVAFGSEVHDYGLDVILGPGMNIQRNPLGGRNFEYFSEDPVVSGTVAAALVNGIQSNGVGVSVKHFIANNQETDRNSVNEFISERALREIYLKNFEIVIKHANPWTVMSSYNLVNDTFTSESHDLLTTVLRNEWGFKGFVMTDWFGGKDAVAQMKAGNNLLMPGNKKQTQQIMDAVKNGTLDEKILDENIAGMLNVMLKSPAFKNYKFSNKPDLKKDAQISRMAAAEGMILLKNTNNALPLKSVKNIALFGINGYDLIAGGTGSGDVNKAYTISLAQGLNNANYTLNNDVKNIYADYVSDYKTKHPRQTIIEQFMHPAPPMPEYVLDNDFITKQAAASDIAVIAIGRNAGEGKDRKVDDDFNLSDTEKTMIKNVADAFHAQNKKVVIVLNIGGVIETTSWRDNADAILLAWQPGLEGGNAMADVLSGKVDPSGKLAVTFPVSYNDVPSAKSFPGKEFPEKATTGGFGMKLIPAEATYDDGIYVGYRYYNTFNVNTAYEFGYGLSYTNFKYSNLTLSSKNFTNKITVTITVTNAGKVDGKEVVQLYISAPSNKLDKPEEELKAFAKTNLLSPGKSQTITFTINASDLASFNTNSTSWIADAGSYSVKIGASSTNIQQTAMFNVSNDIVVEKDHKVLVPKVDINELKPATKQTGFIDELNNFSAIGQ